MLRQIERMKIIAKLILPMCLAATAVLFSSKSQGDLSQAPLLTLHDAIETARSQNPALRQSKERIHQFEELVPLARASLLPNLSLIGNASIHKDAANGPTTRFGGDSYNLYQTDLRLIQPLFQVGILSGVSAAQKDREIRKLETAASARDITKSVVQTFYQAALYSRNVETLVRKQDIVRESVATATKREHTGRGQLLDVLQVKTQVALLDPQIASAKNQLDVAVATLANLLGDIEAHEIRIQAGLGTPTLAEVRRHIDLAHAYFPEIEKDQISIAQVEDQKRVALGQSLPNVSLSGDYIYNSSKKSDLFDSSSESWQIGLQLTIPIFSGLTTLYQQRSLASQQTQFELDRVNLRSQFYLQQVSSLKQLESADQSIRSGEEALRLATASSNEAKRNFRLATIDSLQFLSVEEALVQAEQSLNLSKYNYIVALTNYFVASGQPLDSLVALLEKANL